MKEFMDNDFLLHSNTAKTLFNSYAKDMPIFDYHNHLSAQEIYERRKYENITQLWLGGDHYKWRAMRAVGIEEYFITGNASDREKFLKWAWTVEQIPGNPLYHWTHLELQRYFGIHEPLCEKTAENIWTHCNALLATPGFDALGLLEQRKVTALCTTDEPFDTLEWHLKIKEAPDISMQVLPTFRPDKLLHIEDPAFCGALHKMEKRFDIHINGMADLQLTLQKAIEHFKTAGCILADHGFSSFSYARRGDDGDAEAVLKKAIACEPLNMQEIAVYKGTMLRFLGSEYCKYDMSMQLHLGAQRDNNTPMLQKLGPNFGYDSVGECTKPELISAYLDDLITVGSLPNTVLYCLNPGDNAVLSTMAVNFASGPVRGKVQFGNAWWFEDNVRGISNQLDELMETGLISTFIGMLTDSRSFTSFTRHEYFRRILCDKLGKIIEDGEYPNDLAAMGRMVEDICYNNAVSYFGLNREDA
jgi:glucuronate isomerase